MDTRFLQSFVAVVENGSIAEAARRLNLTAAAVALRIRTLEAELGARLITRSGRNVTATEAGVAILDRTRHFLQQIRDIKSVATNGTIGELRLGAVSTAISGLLPSILTFLIEKYPKAEIYILPGTSAELYNKVVNGELDAAIIARPPFPIPKVCNWRTLRQEPLVVLAPASTRTRDPHALLTGEPFIRYDRNNWGGRLVEMYLRQAGIRPRERFELDGLEAIAVFVSRGLGVSLVPDWAPPWPQGLSLVKLPIPDLSFARHVGVLWREASVRVRLVHALIEAAATKVSLTDKAMQRRAPRDASTGKQKKSKKI